jgi:TetR/AcrR family transcriptional regulator, transcriptional repressor of aconitase
MQLVFHFRSAEEFQCNGGNESMPRPRFQNLAEEKRLALLEAAAKEFAEFGYEQASLNRILETAGMSKGAAYYYFDDKADVFATAVRYYADSMFNDFGAKLMPLEAGEFWPKLKNLYAEHMLLATLDEPWRYGIVRALFGLSEETRTKPEIAEAFSQIQQWVDKLIEEGQIMRVIRTDLPKGLLLTLLMGMDSAADSWFAENAASLEVEEREKLVNRVAETIQSLLAPQ